MSDNLIENRKEIILEISNFFCLIYENKNILINLVFIIASIVVISYYYNKTRINNEAILKKNSTQMTIEKYLSMIRSNDNNEQNAMRFLTLIYEDGLVPDLNLYSTLIEMSYRLLDFESVVNLFSNITNYIGSNFSLDVKTYEIILESFKNLITIKQENQLSIENIKEEFLKNRDKIKLKEFYFSAKIYFSFIQIYIKLGEWMSGWNYFCRMKRKTLFTPDLETNITVLKGMNRNFEKFSIFMGNPNYILEEMLVLVVKGENIDDKHIELRNIFINEVIVLSSKFKLNDLMFRIYQDFFNKNIRFTSDSLSSLLIFFGENSDLNYIFSIYSYTKENIVENVDHLYLILLKFFSKKKLNKLILEIIETIVQSDKIMPNEELYTQIFISSNLCKNYTYSINFFNSIALKKFEITKIDFFNAVMKALIKTKDTTRVFSLYKFILLQNKKSERFPRPDINTYAIIIEAYLITYNISEARKSYNHIKLNKPNLINLEFLNRVSKSYLKAKCYGAALEIMNETKKYKIKHNLKSYRIMFRTFLETCDEFNAILAYDQSVRENVKPDLTIYYLLMQLFVKKNKILQALGMYNDMKINNLQISSEIVNFIILSCLPRNKEEEATLILIDNLKRKIQLESNTLRLVINSLIDNNNMPLDIKTKYLNAILKEIKENHISLSKELYDRLSTIYACE